MHENGASLRGLIGRHKAGWTLERSFYTDPEVYAAEMERVFVSNWLYAGHISLIPKKGDFFQWEVAGAPILIARGNDGQVRAFLNICRHRGTRVCQPPSGNADSFICSYHQWTYDTCGTLKSARLMPRDFDKSRFGLKPVALRIAEGNIFICLAKDPPALDSVLRDVHEHLEPYELDRTKIIHTEEYIVKANWKIVVENFRECYHCVGNHPELCVLMPHVAIDSPAQMEMFQRAVASAEPQWEKMGLCTQSVPMSARGYHVMRFAFRDGIHTQTIDGQPTAPFLGRLTGPDAGVVATSLNPNFWLEVSCDYNTLWRLTPDGPDRSRIRADWLVREDAVEGVDYHPDKVTAFWRVTLDEDWGLCERNHAGVTSRGYEPGPFAPGLDKRATLGESGAGFFVEWYLKQMSREEESHA